MRLVVLRHHEEDGPGLLAEPFESRGFRLEVHDGGRPGALPDPAGVDAAVVLGSVWSVYDRASVGEWIDAELAWLREMDRGGVPVLGVCFGAQALAAAHGGAVEAAPRLELGWVEVESADPELVGPGPWFQWHGDRCVLPLGARVAARTDVAVQAYRVGRALAVQFHPEVDRDQLQRWVDHGGGAELRSHGVEPDALLEQTAGEEPAARRRAERLVERFVELSC